MNVEDQHRRPHLKTELAAIERALEQGKPVLGICLGAQLLAHVLGAPVHRHRQAEIGWYDLHVSAAGRSDAVLGAAGERLPVFQWHSYSYGLPTGATHLARTDTCEQQAFRFGGTAYGFQFHLEADEAVIERWLRLPSFRAELAAAGLPTDEQGIRAETAKLVAATRRSADAVFNNFLDLIGRPSRRRPLPSRGMPAWTD
jgi:GMP synthase (glutamine-hydrolysing)